ncbi:CLUMA_CG017941, isoform A [Clunio marinus]|uniref:CLUMA_CG017941, isoform A n=1 Tax=Clunio marinus TaxID=568069 RepID=A0A1J1IYX4_9DIPT|nr:CLUMA_CG017941, isoform A [Clunio marinus]
MVAMRNFDLWCCYREGCLCLSFCMHDMDLRNIKQNRNGSKREGDKIVTKDNIKVYFTEVSEP